MHNLPSFTSIIANWPENTAAHQRARLLEAIRAHGGVTTLEAARFLDIVDPRPRIVELRKEGYGIVTSWTRQPSECGRFHAVGLYTFASANGVNVTEASNASRENLSRQMTLAL